MTNTVHKWGFYFLVSVLLAAGVSINAPRAVAVQTAQPQLVSDNPADWTPDVLDGSVLSIVQVGSRVVVAGTFTQVREKGSNKPVLNRSGLFSFDAHTGVIDQGFAPIIDSSVEVVRPGPDGRSIYIGGGFKTVNGVSSIGVARLTVPGGSLAPAFRPARLDGRVSDIRLVRDQLVVAGRFLTADGAPRTGLASLNPDSGALTSFVNFAITDPRQGTMNVPKIDATPSGDRLVAIGNFSKVNGADRPQLAVFDTSGDVATLADWQTPFYALNQCSNSFWSYMRDVDIDPTGTYMVVTTTGAYGGSESPCDVESRFELNTGGSGIQPTWRAYTGGDTTYAVAVTGSVVYVGGHMRWMNNPFAGDSQGPGAVARPGIAAIDPRNGIPLSWNPGRQPRGVGVFDMLATDEGLWIGSDTDNVAGETHRKLAFFPLSGGKELPAEKVGTLPNDIYLLGEPAGAADPSVLYRVNAGGPALGSADDGPDWQAGNTGSYVNTGNNATYGAVPFVDASVPAADDDRAPRALFDSERWDSGSDPEMTWSFPVAAGRQLQVRLFLANRYSGTSMPGQRTFDVTLDGNLVLDDLDMVATYGNDTGHMESFDISSDGSVDISFGHVVENPLVNGIEIIDRDLAGTGSVTGGDTVRRQYFTGSGPVSNPLQTEGPEAWSSTRGATLIDDTVYAGKADGTFTRRSFDGQAFGSPRAVDLSGGSFGSDVSSVSGLFYDASDARLYYTLRGSDQLYWRGFLPESAIVGAARFTAGGSLSALDPSRVNGMFLSGESLYFADANTGDLYSVGFRAGTVSGPAVRVDSSIDWRARGVFLWNGSPAAGPNTPPAAGFDAACEGLSCEFDASASADSDGVIVSYDWDFGDSSTGAGKQVSHRFPDSGVFTVELTVTDDRGAQATVNRSVSVTRPPNIDPEANIVPTCNFLSCSFDATGSSDSDGSVTGYEWDFGDGATASGSARVEHTFSTAGDHTVSVTVTDDRGGRDSAAVSVALEVPPAATVAFRAARTFSGNVTSGRVDVPNAVQQGDVLLLFATSNIDTAPVSPPSGWTQVHQQSDSSMRTVLYSRVAGTGDPGAGVTVGYGSQAKVDLTLLAYSGADVATPVAAVASSAEPGVTTTHTAPALASLPPSGVVVSYWIDKTSSTTSWTVGDGSMVVRAVNYGSGSGRLTSVAADHAVTGQNSWPGAAATADSEAGKATMWSVALR